MVDTAGEYFIPTFLLQTSWFCVFVFILVFTFRCVPAELSDDPLSFEAFCRHMPLVCRSGRYGGAHTLYRDPSSSAPFKAGYGIVAFSVLSRTPIWFLIFSITTKSSFILHSLSTLPLR